MNVSASSALMSAGSTSVRFGAGRPSRSRFQYWNSAIDPFSFMPVPLRAFCCPMCHRWTEGRLPATYMLRVAGRMPAQLTLVHGSGPLRLTDGLDCRRRPRVRHINHSIWLLFGTSSGSTPVKSLGRRGLDPPFKGNLERLFFDSRPAIRVLGCSWARRLWIGGECFTCLPWNRIEHP